VPGHDAAGNPAGHPVDDPPDRIPLRRARKGLGVLWLAGGGIFLAILVVQSLTEKYQGILQGVWGWALPTILPALSLVLSVLGYDALREDPLEVTVDRHFYRIVQGLSGAYLGLVLLTLLAEPLSAVETPLELYERSNLWLAPFQALVVSTLGVLFFQSRA
jgi:hypothetical protein